MPLIWHTFAAGTPAPTHIRGSRRPPEYLRRHGGPLRRVCSPHRYRKRLARNAVTNHLRWWRAELRHFYVTDIKPTHIAELRDKLLTAAAVDSNGGPLLDKHGNVRRTKSPATVVRYLASLSVLYTTAVNEWEWARDNPVKKVKRPTEPRKRTILERVGAYPPA